MLFADGRIAQPPIATCEIQGYAYDARLRPPGCPAPCGTTTTRRRGWSATPRG